MHGQQTLAPAAPVGADPAVTPRPRRLRRMEAPPLQPPAYQQAPSRPAMSAAVTMVPVDLGTLLQQMEAVAYAAALRALKDHAEQADRLFDNLAAAEWFYGRARDSGGRWRSLRHYNPWIDGYSVGAGRQRRWTLGSLKEIAQRLGKLPGGEDGSGAAAGG